MRCKASVILLFAVAGLLLLGWPFLTPAQAQSNGKAGAKAHSSGDPDSGSDRQAERDDVRRREEWFYRQRRFPFSALPSGAREHAVEQREAIRRDMIRRGALTNAGPVAPFGPWTPIGPSPTMGTGFLNFQTAPAQFSGRINSIAVDPVNPNIVYLGGALGGLWKSTDGGAHWTVMTDEQPSLAIGAIAIDPNSCTSGSCLTIYVGTGEANFAGDSYYGAGILKSTDGGSTWTQLGANPGSVTLKQPYTPPANTPAPNSFVGPFDVALGGSFFSDIAVNPTNSNKLLASVRIFANADAGASSGIFCSDDAGSHWLQVVAGAAGTALVFDPGGNIAYGALGTAITVAGTGDPQNGVYKTSNATAACASQAWTLSSNGLPSGTTAGRISLAISPSTPSTLYAAVAQGAGGSSTLLGLFKSIDGGNTWTNQNAVDICTPQCFYDMTVKVHPNNANVVFFGGSAVQSASGTDLYLERSTSGGSALTGIAFDGTTEIHEDQHAIAFSPPTTGASNYTMLVGNDGGLWSTPVGASGTGAISWTNQNATLTLSQFYPGISIHPASQLVAIGGLQDNGSQKYDAGTNAATPNVWTQILFADGGFTYIDPVTPNVVYGTTQFTGNGDPLFIQKSVVSGDMDSSGNLGFSAATSGINANDFGEFIPPLVGDPTPGNNRVLYFGTCQVYQSVDGAGNWAPMASSSLCGTGDDYTTIAAAADGNTVYAGTFLGHVQMTAGAIAGGNAAWTDVSHPPLPAATSQSNPTDGRTITKVAVDPNNPKFALVAYSGFCGFNNITSGAPDNVGHLFQTTNGGTSWTDISGGCSTANGLPNTPINDIVIDPTDPTDATIYIATDVGVFFTTNGGTAWTLLDQSPRTLPDAAVLSLTLRNASRTLRAGMHGRSVWDFQLPLTAAQQLYSLTSITPVFAVEGSASNVTLTVNGNGFLAGDTVQFGAIPLATTFVSATQLTATIPAAQLAAAATAAITVADTARGATNAVPFSVVVTSASPAPMNDAFPGFNITSNTYSDTENTFAATTNTSGITDPLPACVQNPPSSVPPAANGGAANSIWYHWTAPANALVEADTVGSAEDTILLVVTGTGNNPSTFTQTACNDDIVSGVVATSKVSFPAVSGSSYYFMISNYEGSTSSTSIGSTIIFNFNASFQPTATSINPASAMTGTSVPFTIAGQNFTVPLFVNAGGASGVSFTNVQLVSSTMITGTLNIAQTATLGAITIFVDTNGGAAPLSFTVLAGPPTLASIAPPSGAVGTSVGITVTGSNFDGTSMINLGGTGITLQAVSVTSSTTITATFVIAANAPLGAQNVTVTTAQGISGAVTFTVTSVPPPTLTSINPTAGAQGTSVPVTLTGTNLSGASINFSGMGISIGPSGITVAAGGNSLTATFVIAANAPIGPQNVTVTTPGGGTSGPVSFTVASDFSMSASATSATVARGSTATAMLTVQPTTAGAPFPGPVTFSCSGVPSLTTTNCNTLTLPAFTAPANVNMVSVTFTPAAPSLLAPRTRGLRLPGAPLAGRAAALAWLGLVVALCAALAAARRRQRPAGARYALAAALIFALAALAAACGGGGGGSSNGGGSPGTPPGTYPIVVTASSASATHTITYTLTVQ